jgi:hypothetical protein
MSNYKAKPRAMVMGISIIGTVEGLGPYKETGNRILAQSGIQDLKLDGWYPVQSFSDFFDVISSKMEMRPC